MEKKSCHCDNDNKIVITCSGAADVGYISDLAARKLSKSHNRKMSCLALFATCNNQQINEFKKKDIFLIDGCAENCGKKILEKRGIKNYTYLRVTDLGFKKGSTPFVKGAVESVYETYNRMV